MGLRIFGNNSTAQATWVDSPQGRGSWDLLSTCIITLGLCVYSALHLNISSSESSLWYKIGVRTRWLLVGLFAPEAVVYNAWEQRREANEIARVLREHCGQPHPRSWYSKLLGHLLGKGAIKTKEKLAEDLWTLAHGYYIVMGGFCFDMKHDSQRVWPRGLDRMTLLPAGIPHLLDHFPDFEIPFVPLKDISDKSKANHLAKSIVCLQALWFCAQFFRQLAKGLPVSLLELNTVAHALCALLIYIIWWNKPLDIDEPTLIRTESCETARDICALGLSQSRIYKES